MVRSDGRGEYKSNEFKRHCEELGLQHNITCPYTPQHNEVVERKNRTIMDMARSTLKAKGMPNYFWAEAVTCVVYLINRSPTRSVPKTTPIEACSGFKPNVQHLKVFGSITYAHVSKAARSKLDDKAEKTIFIGYKHGGYKVYNPMTKKVIISRDVTFVEDEEWEWNATTEMDSKKQYIYVLNDDMEDGVSLEAPAVQPEAVIQPEVATAIVIMMERPRRQQGQPVHLQDCEVNLEDEVDDNGDLIHFSFLADSKPVRLEDAIQHAKLQEAMNEELMAIEKNNT